MKKKVIQKGLQKLTENLTAEKIELLVLNDDKEQLQAMQGELTNVMNENVNKSIDYTLPDEERREAAFKFEKASRWLFCLFENVNRKYGEGEIKMEFQNTIKRVTYDINRISIMRAIRDTANNQNKIPNQTEIARITGLSRTTIAKHMTDVYKDREYNELKQSSAVLLPRVIARLYTLGMEGNVKALKVFLDFHKQDTGTTFIKGQNNYIQINETVLSQETIRQLNTEQINAIECILRAAAPKLKVLDDSSRMIQ
ncbi:MAG: hypothetical protein JNJ58_12865 [Chitinophagaceae bacterium]|nr:hypothetical protein [Chitinophagaceae bacterium]